MLDGLEPYPKSTIEFVAPRPIPPNTRYTLCMALREIYAVVEDPELRLKLRYVATLAKAVTDKLSELDPAWLYLMYPQMREYNKLMRRDDGGI